MPRSFRGHRPAASAVLVLVLAVGGCAGRDGGGSDAASRPIEATAAVDHATATIGDRLRYSVRVDAPRGTRVEVADPVADGSIGGLSVVDSGESTKDRLGRHFEERWWEVRADRTGSFQLDAPKVTYHGVDGAEGELSPDQVLVEVASVLPEGAEDIRDVKPPRRRFAVSPVLLGAIAAGVLLLAVLVWWLRRRRRRRAQPEAPLLPHEVALRALDRLRRTNFASLEELRAYYFEISEVLRRYVEERFGLNATDLTTEEILPRLADLRELRAEDAVCFRDFLGETDLVKYAAEVPSTLAIERTWELALGFVESTRPAPVEVAAEPPAGSGATGGGDAEVVGAPPIADAHGTNG